MKLKVLSNNRLENPGKCKTCKFSSTWLEYGSWNWDCTHKDFDKSKTIMNPEKQIRLESNGWKIGNTEDFLNDITKGLVSVYCLMTNQNQFLCFSEENKNYYLNDSKNSDLVIIYSPQKEQETIKLYQKIAGVFLNSVSNVIEYQDNESYREIQ